MVRGDWDERGVYIYVYVHRLLSGLLVDRGFCCVRAKVFA